MIQAWKNKAPLLSRATSFVLIFLLLLFFCFLLHFLLLLFFLLQLPFLLLFFLLPHLPLFKDKICSLG